MKRLGLGLVAAVVWGGMAQAAMIRLEPTPTLGAPIEYHDGMAGAHSALGGSEVAILIARATQDEKDAPIIGIAVRNLGKGAFNLTPANVEVLTDGGEALRVYSRDEVVAVTLDRARKRERWARIGAGLGAFGAGLRDEPQRPDPNLAREIERAQVEGALAVEAAHDQGFVAETVDPGETHRTELGLSALPKGVQGLTIKVTLGEEIHTFPLKVLR